MSDLRRDVPPRLAGTALSSVWAHDLEARRRIQRFAALGVENRDPIRVLRQALAVEGDHGDVLGGLERPDGEAVRALIGGYLDQGGRLEAPDREAIYNGLVGSGLRRRLRENERDSVEPLFERYAFLLA